MQEPLWEFETHPTDHAETPIEAYEDIAPVLDFVSHTLNCTRSTIKIWDPFFCQGSMVERLGSLGFTSVINKNEDAYQVFSESREPPHNVLLTNPPFSGHHIERLFSYCTAKRANDFWFLLVPEYIARKAYFMEYKRLSENKNGCPVCYLGPKSKPYAFTIPKQISGEQLQPSTNPTKPSERPTTTFQCIWFINTGKHKDELLAWWEENQHLNPRQSVLSPNIEDLPQLAEKATNRLTPAERRWRKKQREGRASKNETPVGSGRTREARGPGSKKRKKAQTGPVKTKRVRK